jgi:hypothetical protein
LTSPSALRDRTRTRVPLAAAGSAVGRRATAAAIEEAVAKLQQEPSFVLFFPATGNPDETARQAREAAAGVPIAGMTGSDAIAAAGPLEGGCSAIAFSASVSVGIGVAERASRDRRAAGRAAATEAFARLDESRGDAVLLLFLDPDSGDVADTVAGAYEVTGGHVRFAGGAAGGPVRAQFAAGRAHSDSVVAAAVASPYPIGVGVAHGCVPRAIPSIVTRADGHSILRLDGRPAEAVYVEKLGHNGGARLGDAEFDALAVLHPLAQRELSGDVRMRYVRGRGHRGELVCATPIPENAAVEVCEETPEEILRSATAAASDARAALGRRAARATLVFECASRKRAVRNTVARREVEAITAALSGRRPALAGVYTRGEIARIRGAKGDRNHTIVVVAF